MSDLFPIRRNKANSDPKDTPLVTPDVPVTMKKATITTSLVELPVFPLCQSAIQAVVEKDGFYINTLSIYKELENHSSQIYLRKKMGTIHAAHAAFKLRKLCLNLEWNSTDTKWEEIVPTEWEWCVSHRDLEAFLKWAQARTRKPLSEKIRLFKKFNIVLSEEDIKVPIENEVLDVLQQCIPFQMELQYRVGKYRLDAFIPRLRIAIQIDEHGHKNYDSQEEKVYDEVIRDNNIVCLRFNPHGQYTSTPALELVRQVWEKTMSPDFVTFREKNKLV